MKTNNNQRMAIVLNGGKSELNSATIPVEWWFSKEVIAGEKPPKYLLIIEQTPDDDGYHGRRYFCKVEEKVAFLQLFKSGRHTIRVLAFSSERQDFYGRLLHYFLEKDEKKKNYVRYVDAEADLPSEIAPNNSDIEEALVAFSKQEFTAPKELFAVKKKNSLLWRWANKFFRFLEMGDPIDECAYRRRIIFSLTIQVPCYLVYFIIRYLITGVLYATYVLLASLIVFFFGFRPKPIIKEVWAALRVIRPAQHDKTADRYTGWNVLLYRGGDSTYRLWRGDKDYRRDSINVFMPITPFEVVFQLSCLGIIIYLFTFVSKGAVISVSVYIASIGTAFFFLVLANKMIRRFWKNFVLLVFLDKLFERLGDKLGAFLERTRDRKRQKKILEEQDYAKWLRDYCILDKQTGAVNLKDYHPFKHEAVKRFHVGFWNLKAQVCKPYAES